MIFERHVYAVFRRRAERGERGLADPGAGQVLGARRAVLGGGAGQAPHQLRALPARLPLALRVHRPIWNERGRRTSHQVTVTSHYLNLNLRSGQAPHQLCALPAQFPLALRVHGALRHERGGRAQHPVCTAVLPLWLVMMYCLSGVYALFGMNAAAVHHIT